MVYHIGVYGAASKEGEDVVGMARRVGRALAEAGCVVITGGCSGSPYEAARSAADAGGVVWGFTPAVNMEEHREFVPEDDPRVYARLQFVPATFPFNADLPVAKKYRNVISTAHCDGAIIIGGRWGTLNELTNLIDFGKVVGVLLGSGPLTDALPALVESLGVEMGARVIFDADPEELVRRVIAEVDEHRAR